MYLSQKHFDDLLKNAGEDVKNLDRRERLGSNAMLYSTGTKLFIFYVNTLVFKKDLTGAVTLNTNGWETMTTKKHINHGLKLAGLNYYINQKAFEWYLIKHDNEYQVIEKIDFKDNMILKS